MGGLRAPPGGDRGRHSHSGSRRGPRGGVAGLSQASSKACASCAASLPAPITTVRPRAVPPGSCPSSARAGSAAATAARKRGWRGRRGRRGSSRSPGHEDQLSSPPKKDQPRRWHRRPSVAALLIRAAPGDRPEGCRPRPAPIFSLPEISGTRRAAGAAGQSPRHPPSTAARQGGSARRSGLAPPRRGPRGGTSQRPRARRPPGALDHARPPGGHPQGAGLFPVQQVEGVVLPACATTDPCPPARNQQSRRGAERRTRDARCRWPDSTTSAPQSDSCARAAAPRRISRLSTFGPCSSG